MQWHSFADDLSNACSCICLFQPSATKESGSDRWLVRWVKELRYLAFHHPGTFGCAYSHPDKRSKSEWYWCFSPLLRHKGSRWVLPFFFRLGHLHRCVSFVVWSGLDLRSLQTAGARTAERWTIKREQGIGCARRYPCYQTATSFSGGDGVMKSS